LIFNDDGALLTPKQRQVFQIGSPVRGKDWEDVDMNGGTSTSAYGGGGLLQQDQNNSNSQKKDTTPVSDADFVRMLAQQGQSDHDRYSPQSAVTISTTTADGDAGSVFYDEPTPTTMDPAQWTTLSEGFQSPSFREKLGRLMQQKHRQYEKKSIVEKHQERRAKERKTLREQERRERHKEMERQIEDLEAAFGVEAVAAAATTTTTTNEYHSPVQVSSLGFEISMEIVSSTTTTGHTEHEHEHEQ
jgi:hypothetical protein